MSIFRTFWYFIEFLIVINLITRNNRPDFIWMIIFLAITKSLLRSKMPNFLLFLQCVRIIKSGCQRYWLLFHSNNSFLKNQFKSTLDSSHKRFPKETTPYFLRYVNHNAYFFTQTVNYSDSKDGGDSSDDEASQEESQHSENQENLDPECEIPFNDTVETAIDKTKVSSSVSSTPQKRKAESELVKNIKRSKSVDALNETDIESNLSLQLERDSQIKDSENDDSRSYSSIADSPTTIFNRLIQGYEGTARVRNTCSEGDQKEVKSLPRDKIEESHSHESQDSLQEAAKSSVTSESPRRTVSSEKRLEDKASTSSTLIQAFDRLSTQLFTSDTTDLSQEEGESYFHKKFRSSGSSMLESKDISKSKDSVHFHRTNKRDKSTDKEPDNKIYQLPVSNSNVTGETSKQTVRVQKTFIPAAYSVCDSSASTEKIAEMSDRAINVENNSQNKIRVDDAPKPNIFLEGLGQRLAETTRELFESFNEKSCKIVNIHETNETKDPEESSLEYACPEEYRNNNIESAEGGSDPSDSWNRPGPSSEPEWFSSYPYVSDIGSKRPQYYRSYPGLTLQPLSAKKDANYQKRFYREKKEIVLPIKSGKIIRWSNKVSKKLVHKVPKITNSEEEKLPLFIYHELALELAQGFIAAYNNMKKEKLKYLKDKNKPRQKKNSEKICYAQSSFQEESPPSDNSDDDISLDSQESIKSPPPSIASLSRHPSESDLTEVYVSPLKPIASVSQPVSVQRMIKNTSSVDLIQSTDFKLPNFSFDTTEKNSGVCIEPKPEKLCDYGDYSSDHIPLQPVRIRFVRYEDLGDPRRFIFCRDNFNVSHTDDEIPIQLKAFFKIDEVRTLKRPILPMSVEEFLKILFELQQYYYQTMYDERNLFYTFRKELTRCVIPMRHYESHDEDYELIGDTLQRSTPRSEQILRSLSSTSLNIDSHQQTQSCSYVQENLNVDVPQSHRLTSEINLPSFEKTEMTTKNMFQTLIPRFSCTDTLTLDGEPKSETVEESEFTHRSFDDIATISEEPKNTLSPETSREGGSSQKSLNQQFENVDLPEEFLSKISFNDVNEERRSILESLKLAVSESLNECTSMSRDDQRKVQESLQASSISKENLEMFEDEQRAILESLSTLEPSHSMDYGAITRGKQCESLVVTTEETSRMHDKKLRVQHDFMKRLELGKLSDVEDQDIPSPTVDYKSTPKFSISEKENLLEKICATDESLLEFEKGKIYLSSCKENPSTNITTSDSVKQETRFQLAEESSCSSSSSTQLPVIIDVRGNVDPEKEPMESSSDLSQVDDEDKSVCSKQSREDKS